MLWSILYVRPKYTLQLNKEEEEEEVQSEGRKKN